MAAICAGMWGSWASRNRTRTGDGPELAGYAKFRAAMEKAEADEVAPQAGEGRAALSAAAVSEPSRIHRAGSGSGPARAS
ncbi:hypothetical protein [Streptomyces sp. Da 82-17]|uniref:hypothetical protein n=1 Tax=Streptomyces sp. Da 82-17 TaxID=3377116 RepID=UPI0038D49E47